MGAAFFGDWTANPDNQICLYPRLHEKQSVGQETSLLSILREQKVSVSASDRGLAPKFISDFLECYRKDSERVTSFIISPKDLVCFIGTLFPSCREAPRTCELVANDVWPRPRSRATTATA